MWEQKKADNKKDQEKKVTGLYFSLLEVVHWPGTVPLIIGSTLAIQNSCTVISTRTAVPA